MNLNHRRHERRRKFTIMGLPGNAPCFENKQKFISKFLTVEE